MIFLFIASLVCAVCYYEDNKNLKSENKALKFKVDNLEIAVLQKEAIIQILKTGKSDGSNDNTRF